LDNFFVQYYLDLAREVLGAKMSPVPVRESTALRRSVERPWKDNPYPNSEFIWLGLSWERALSSYLSWALITDSNCGAYDILTDL